MAEMIQIMPYWPRERYLELAPRYWRKTRASLVTKELDRAVGPITGTITEPPPASSAKE
jgi:hypothetical protein